METFQEQIVTNDGATEILDDLAPLLVMMKIYLDRGVKTDATDGIATVAAAVFKRVPYKQFVRPWNRMLSGWGADVFHATDFYVGAGQFKRNTPERKALHDRDSKVIPGLIGSHAARLIAIGFRPAEFESVASDAFKKEYGTSLHSFAVQLVLIVNGWWAQDIRYHEGFSCFMESGDDDETEVISTVHRMKVHPETASHIQVKSFTSIDKGEARGIEAADCLAWHWNKYYMDKFRVGREDEARRDFAAMMEIAENKVYMSLMVGDKLKDILSRAPLLDGASGVA